ncbi:type II toxin-antitoxin system ParD family antitoxin [Bosea caraganae]|uniref:Type II toxin-antitoxin system ParD family antitoxin n=1 Tax=Bosea caraganae TaxID=2763117 RepID=A0A370LAF3_9HYPH|nr:type II toxin-antitoxin system ParD family antitoxin [Bosea caraganae]RDJ21662.1 type II toxin-antitoxin system ParD family antitoxin [Bosea caraganae]RDJ28308.1 type II toxin-antitoxin system ParD family antitoxin [Bosea caraganae]
MATMTISLPVAMKDWVEAQIAQGEFASTSDYVRDLIRRDRERRSKSELTLDDLRRIVDESRKSGIGNRPLNEILAEGDQIAKARGIFRE